MLGRIRANNSVRVFKEAFTRLQRYTKRTPLVKLKKETGEPHPRARLPRWAEAMTCRVETSGTVYKDAPFLLSMGLLMGL
jgi:hypothetical protein